MLARIADIAVARRRIILVLALVVFAAGGALGGNVAQELSGGGFEDTSSESYQAEEILDEEFGVGVPNLVLLVTATQPAVGEDPAVDAPAVQQAGLALTDRLAADPTLENVTSYWSIGNLPPFRSEDGTKALVVARILGDEDTVDARVEELTHGLHERFDASAEAIDVQVTGFAETFRQVSEQIEVDLVRAELIAIPITLVLLLFIFRGVVAAMLPLAIGALSVVNTFLVLRIINEFTQVSVFALNLTTAMGLGLAIDYALFVVNRFREELAAGHDPDTAVRRTVRTAGRTVAFSAGTVAVSLLALLVFPLAFLKSFAYAGVAVATLAGLFSVIVLPAMLAALGTRVNALPIRLRKSAHDRPEEDGFWYRTASRVMRRPVGITVAVVLVLVFLGTPFLRANLALPDDRVLPEDAPARAAADVIRDEFDSNEAGATSIVARDIGDLSDPAVRAGIHEYASAVSALDGAERVDAVTGIYADGDLVLDAETAAALAPGAVARFQSDDDLYLSVVPDHEPNSTTGRDFVGKIRSLDTPFDAAGVEVRVTGPSAMLADTTSALLGRLPLAVGLVAAITFVLLFLMFGSVVIPLKALVLNVLSLTATFGAMVWVFQDGNLSGVLGFTATGGLDATTPILMFCVAFGLSMDYEVFLLSRIKEEHDAGADDPRAVALGLERTGRIVTAAALLISVVFLAFGTSEVRFIKLFGLGLALAVLMDAFVIRGTLVPAFMRMAGSANWWAPAPLRRFHQRYGVSEHVDLDDNVLGATSTVADCTSRPKNQTQNVLGATSTVADRANHPKNDGVVPRPIQESDESDESVPARMELVEQLPTSRRRRRPLVAAGRAAPWERE